MGPTYIHPSRKRPVVPFMTLFSLWFTYSFTHSFTKSFTCSFTHSFILAFRHSYFHAIYPNSIDFYGYISVVFFLTHHPLYFSPSSNPILFYHVLCAMLNVSHHRHALRRRRSLVAKRAISLAGISCRPLGLDSAGRGVL